LTAAATTTETTTTTTTTTITAATRSDRDSHLIWVDRINKRLRDGNLLDARHVKAIYIVPKVDFFVLVLGVLYSDNVEVCDVGHDHAALGEPPVGDKDSIFRFWNL
jgi:hypothetical protein